MSFILFTIFFITLIGIIFKLFPKYEINAFQAIVANYAVCVALSWLHSGNFPIEERVLQAPWIDLAIVLSFCFILGFYLQSILFKIFGIAISTIVLKLSLVLTAIFVIIVYDEIVGLSKASGLLLALVAIVLVSYPSGKTLDSKKSKTSWIAWIVLIGSYLISAGVDIGFTLVERSASTKVADPQFIGCATGLAFIWGCGVEFTRIFKGTSTLALKNITGGIILGVANYATFYGMMRSISSGIDTSIVFTSINIGVILASLIIGIILFQEKLAKINLVGVAVAILSVFLISFNI